MKGVNAVHCEHWVSLFGPGQAVATSPDRLRGEVLTILEPFSVLPYPPPQLETSKSSRKIGTAIMDSTTNHSGTPWRGDATDRRQIVDRLKNFILRDLIPAPGSQRRTLVRDFARSLPTGMSLYSQAELAYVFPLVINPVLPPRLERAFTLSMPQPVELPHLDKDREIIERFLLDELPIIKDNVAQITVAMATLFESLTHGHEEACRNHLMYVFEYYMKDNPASRWILGLARSHCEKNHQHMEALAMSPPDSAHLHYLTIGPPTDSHDYDSEVLREPTARIPYRNSRTKTEPCAGEEYGGSDHDDRR